MSAQRRILISFAVTLLVWAVYSWPLPLHVFRAIPSSAQNTEPQHVRTMIAGDHLQLLYQFWLAGDMIRGKTPVFHNLYEFNTGDDAARRQFRTHYLPFSFVYLLGDLAGGRAFGWNVAGFISLWGTYVLTWLLIGRYVRRDDIAAVCALIGLVFPFRWINLLGGSPMGYAMIWAPAILLGIDLAVRDHRTAGGWLAGIAILFSAWTDSHMFFFAVLAAPAWCGVALLTELPFNMPVRRLLWRWTRALWPVAILTITAFVVSKATFSKGTQAALSEGGRALNEVGAFSPRWIGWFSWNASGISGQIYLGYAVLAVLAAGAGVLAWRAIRRESDDTRPWWRLPLLFGLLGAGVCALALLALGTHGPFHGKLLVLARKLIPPYTMIRQPAKIYCLLPSLLALMAALSWSVLAARRPGRIVAWALAVWAAALLVEYRLMVSPTLCRLDRDQPAYRMVADDAAAAGMVPRVVVIPLWPGDSHWASLYEHNVSLYRIRMVNGYHPVVQKHYLDDIFQRLEGLNKGWLGDESLAFLRASGVQYVLLHEDAFPEKVSPFAVGFTLQRLLAHPRLRFLAQAGAVWAFKIVNETDPRPASPSIATGNMAFPARRWEAESLLRAGTTAGGGEWPGRPRFAILAQAGQAIETRPVRVPSTPDLAWLLRVRGDGTVRATLIEDGRDGATETLASTGDSWTWVRVPAGMTRPYGSIAGRFEHASGRVDVDMVLLTAGTWTPPAAGETVTLPAAAFFHAGYTDSRAGDVVLTAGRDPADVVFYGLRLPLDPGHYTAEMIFASPAAAGVELGRWTAGEGGPKVVFGTAAVTAGRPAVCEWAQPDNRPCSLEFRFAGRAGIRIREVRLTRVQ